MKRAPGSGIRACVILIGGLVGGSLAGVIYVIVRYLMSANSEIPRLNAELYLTGGAVLGAPAGLVATMILLVLLWIKRRSGARSLLAVAVTCVVAGFASTALTWAVLTSLNEQTDALLFIVGFGAAASAWCFLLCVVARSLALSRALPRGSQESLG